MELDSWMRGSICERCHYMVSFFLFSSFIPTYGIISHSSTPSIFLDPSVLVHIKMLLSLSKGCMSVCKSHNLDSASSLLGLLRDDTRDWNVLFCSKQNLKNDLYAMVGNSLQSPGYFLSPPCSTPFFSFAFPKATSFCPRRGTTSSTSQAVTPQN